MDPVVSLEVSALSRMRTITALTALGGSAVQRAYNGSCAFVTGASGFLGKQLVEKLLRSTDIKIIYLLLRPKKEKSVEDRLKEIINNPVFETLSKLKPGFSDKLQAVSGDITELRLGISEEQRTILAHEVNFIFHVAATTRFDEPLTSATITNVRGTREVIALAKDCKKLKSLVYVSTAYSHATLSRRNKDVLEEFYQVPLAPDVLIDMAEKMDEDKLRDVSKVIMEDWPNTYSFTKAVAEEVVRANSDGIPACIVRPAIVLAAYREPSPGWVDNTCIYGPAGVMIGVGLGLVHTMYADTTVKIDPVPVDLVNNAVIAAGWATATNPGVKETRIYAVTASRHPTTWADCAQVHRNESRKISTPKAVWYCYCLVTKHLWLFWLLFWLLHYIPAYVFDGAGLMIGKKPKFVKLYTKAYKLFTLTSYFVKNEWRFSDKNSRSLLKCMSETDRQIYNFDVESVDWKEFMLIWCLGLRKYILKDGLKDTDYAVKKQYVFKLLNALVLTFYAYFWWSVLRVLSNTLLRLF